VKGNKRVLIPSQALETPVECGVTSNAKTTKNVQICLVSTGANTHNQGAKKYHYQCWMQIAASGFVKVKVDDLTYLEINYSGDTRNGQINCDTFIYASQDVNVPYQIDDLGFVDPTDDSGGAGETTWPGILILSAPENRRPWQL
jgi:hypothetical protein